MEEVKGRGRASTHGAFLFGWRLEIVSSKPVLSFWGRKRGVSGEKRRGGGGSGASGGSGWSGRGIEGLGNGLQAQESTSKERVWVVDFVGGVPWSRAEGGGFG